MIDQRDERHRAMWCKQDGSQRAGTGHIDGNWLIHCMYFTLLRHIVC